MEHGFVLKFELPPGLAGDDERIMSLVKKAGCDDALVGLGKQGCIALEFVREGENREETVKSASEALERVFGNSLV